MISLTPHQLKALNYRNHTSLTANAGSGKTFVLSKRFLEIALNENISLRNIAAITFTDKAAGELYKKIADQIEEKINSTDDEKLLKKLENLRRQLVSANISTIHSFCIDILKENPVEAGIDANFIPIEEQASNELIELSIEEVIKKSLQKKEDKQRLKYLIRIFSSKTVFAKELKSLIKNRKNVLTLYDKIYKYPEDQIAETFHLKFLELTEDILFDSSFDKKKVEIISAAKKTNDFVLSEKRGNPTAVNINRILSKLSLENDIENSLQLFHELKNEICTGNVTIKKAGYLNNPGSKLEVEIQLLENFFNELKYFINEKNHFEIELELARYGKELIYFFNKTLELYNSKKKDNGYLDFEDILLISFELLKKRNIRQALAKKFEYIMIDEYQDTNEVQYQIFLPILDYLKRGNLFVVGDEKQSIYMFRDAELEVFFQTKKEIEQSSGSENILSLPESFRMAPNLCVFTNYLFRNLFYNTRIAGNLFNEVDHSDLVCAREDNIEGKVEILLTEKNENSTPVVEKNSEAELIAKRILNLINENGQGQMLNWSDIAILSRKRKNFSELEKTFVKYNIPFSIVGGKGFYQKQIVYDIFNYFSFLLDTNNNAALIGILRSPFFSISDSEIFEISLENEDNYWQKFRNYSERKINCKTAVKIISENISLITNIEIPALLRKILKESDILSVIAAQPNGLQELANIEKLIKLTINFSSQGFSTLYDYITFLKDSIEKTEDEAQAAVSEESNLSAGQAGSVKIMTLHQAKGLEFPAVFLFKCDESSKSPGMKSKEVFVDKNLGLLSKLPVNENYFSDYQSAPVIGVANFISSKKNIAELKRLFYVGITRAKNYLFISAEEKKSYAKDSFMGLLSEVFDFKLNPLSFVLNEKLKLLKKTGNQYSNDEKEIYFNIPVIRKIEEFHSITEEKPESEAEKKIIIEEIKDKTENEIISATKISVFKQCPLKYQLTYEYGFSPILNQYKNWFRNNQANTYFEFSDKEDSRIIDSDAGEKSKEYSPAFSADEKGRIIHLVLQNELPIEAVENFVERQLKNEVEFLGQKDESFLDFKKEIVDDLKKFYASDMVKNLKKKNKFKNEFEIYIKENNYFLYGIIDKIIFEDNKIIIFDYKTDNITKSEISERVLTYINQLKFYSYIVSNLFPNFDIFELRLLFVIHPGEFISEILSKKEAANFGNEIKELVDKIRNKDFPKNLDHCRKCYYAVNGACIKN